MRAKSYSIEESLRAKCVRVKVSLYDARVVVVVPQGFDRGQVPEIVREKQSWIERVQKQVIEQRELAGTNGTSVLPERISLRAVGEEWGVTYEGTATGAPVVYETPDDRLLVRGDLSDPQLCRQALQRWVRRKAHAHLVPWLEGLSRDQRLAIGRTVVRAQRSRWGSCSRHRTISINQKLLFVPARLVRYVFLHELCHVEHFDHSPAFWRALERREPGCKALDSELDTAWRYVPVWMCA